MKCPVCKLENPQNSEKCSCGGYNFKYVRLEESVKDPGDTKKEKRIALAILFSVVAFFLIFILGEGFGAWALFVGMGAYFFVTQYLLSRGNAWPVRNDWPIIIALNSAPAFMIVLALAIEPNKLAVLQMLGVTILCLACSYAGAALASRPPRAERSINNGLR
jgi:hypothetical membrane protein